MSEQELVLNVKELHVLSVTCSECGHGTIFDFQSSDYLEKSVSPQCGVCKRELAVNLRERLQAYRCFYDSMSAYDRIEFRVRLQRPEEAMAAAVVESASAVQQAAAAGVQDAVARALAKEHGMADLVDGRFLGFGKN
jgi:hypothetical protein